MNYESDRLLDKAAKAIGEGNLVAFPTETVYGLGADALNPQAVAKIFDAKERPRFNPLIVHIDSAEMLSSLAETVPPEAHLLIDRFWPGPLTLVLPKKGTVPDLVSAGLASVGIRMPDNPIALELIRRAKKPIAAPSANKFGQISPTTAEHVREQLEEVVEVILDGGSCMVGVESTIVSLAHDRPLLLRPGGLAPEAIEEVIGKLEVPDMNSMKNVSPGRSLRHYAPGTRLILGDPTARLEAGRKALLTCRPQPEEVTKNYEVVEVLSETGDLGEAACKLFASLRKLDTEELDLIVAVPAPNRGLGFAINDRLQRAATERE